MGSQRVWEPKKGVHQAQPLGQRVGVWSCVSYDEEKMSSAWGILGCV